MNVPLTRAEYEALPFRETLVNEPVQDAYFRTRHSPGYVYKMRIRKKWPRSRWSLPPQTRGRYGRIV